MNDAETTRQRALDWQRANQTILAAGVAEVRADMERFLAQQSNAAVEPPPPPSQLTLVDESGQPLTSTLDSLCRLFELTPLERKIVLLCLGVETDSRFASLCARVHGKDDMAYPTICLALRVFEETDWSVCSPHGALRKWDIIEVGQGKGRVFQPIALSERILDYLLDHPGIDQRLLGIVQPVNEPVNGASLSAEERALVHDVVAHMVQSTPAAASPVMQLCGGDALQNRKLAQVTATILGCELHALSLEYLPHDPVHLDRVLRLWEREAILGQSLLLVECFAPSRANYHPGPPLNWVLDRLRCPVLVSSQGPQLTKLRRLASATVPGRPRQQQASWWRAGMPGQELSDGDEDGWQDRLPAHPGA